MTTTISLQKSTSIPRRVAAVLAAILTGCVNHAPHADEHISERNEELQAFPEADSLLQTALGRGDFAGAVLLVAVDGEVVHHTALGYAYRFTEELDQAPDPDPMTTGHIFDLASLTKVMATTYAVMVLADRGEIDVNENVITYLPAFSGGYRDEITVRQLLTHTSGLPPWRPLYMHAGGPAGVLREIRNTPLAYQPGTERRYSDLGFMLLGYLIESVSGQPLDEFLEHGLYEKLELRQTKFNPKQHGRTSFVATSHGNPFEYRMIEDPDFGYAVPEDPRDFERWRDYTLRGEVNDGNAFYAHSGVAGHAGLFSTAAELHVLLGLLLDGGMYDGRPILSRDTISLFLSPDAFGNGLGWWMNRETIGIADLPDGSFWHTGFTGTFAMAVPEPDLTIILLTNRQHPGMGPDGYPNLWPLQRSLVSLILGRSHR